MQIYGKIAHLATLTKQSRLKSGASGLLAGFRNGSVQKWSNSDTVVKHDVNISVEYNQQCMEGVCNNKDK